MLCSQREQLWESYNQALDYFSQRVTELTSSRSLSASQFATNAHRCQQANVKCMAARAAWEQHLKDHGCDPTTAKVESQSGKQRG